MSFRFVLMLAFYTGSGLIAQEPETSQADQAIQAKSGQVGSSAASTLLPAGTPLSAQLEDHVPLRRGQAIHARLLYQVFNENKLVLPAGTMLDGTVVDLIPDRAHRLASGLRGDFTPFRTPAVTFKSLTTPEGRVVPLETQLVTTGAPMFSLVPPPPKKGGVIRQQFAIGKQMAKDRLEIVTGPDKRDRVVQFLYTQLPYHPQRIQKGTAWTVETTQPVLLPPVSQDQKDRGAVASSAATPTSEHAPDQAQWILNASLLEELSSKTTVKGSPVHAVVMEPIYNRDQTVAVPQGSVLDGAVTQARPARRFGRAGLLRFDFRQLTFPDGHNSQNVQTSLRGIDAIGGEKLALDSEGKLQPKPQDKVLVPLILFALASRPLDRDHGDNSFGKDAVASNSLGLVGFLVGTAGGWHNVASGIGYYGTALSVYNRWIKRGQEIAFVHDTRIVVQTTARRTAPLRPTPR